jgi:hypothetical protein
MPAKTTAPIKKALKRAATPVTTHPHLQTARSIEDRSPQLLEEMHQVMQKHGFSALKIRSMTFSGSSPEPSSPTGLCPRWRCHTDSSGHTVCGWVMEPC